MNRLDLIIDALENSEPTGTGWVHVHEQKHQAALAAARELIAQPEQKLIGWKDGEPQYVAQPEQEEFAPYTGKGEESKIKHLLEPKPEQEPVHFLANGVRYKVTHQGYYGCSIVGLPENLNGQWVALVEATDSKHLNCIPPQESTKPEQNPVAWWNGQGSDFGADDEDFIYPETRQNHFKADSHADYWSIPLYTAPVSKPWVSLTDEDIIDAFDPFLNNIEKGRAIEAALRSKNNG